ncbi:MAG: sulfatase [Patescibacteria group bacterium]|nr:sulfatase [Patescibacteria group bacterium]
MESLLGIGNEQYSSFGSFTFSKNGVPTVRQTILNGKQITYNSRVYKIGQIGYRRDCPIDYNKGIDFERCEAWLAPTPLTDLIPGRGSDQSFDAISSFVFSKLNSQNVRETYLRQTFYYKNGQKGRARDCLMTTFGPDFNQCVWQAEANLSNIRGVGGESYSSFSAKIITPTGGGGSYLRQVLIPRGSINIAYTRNCPANNDVGIQFNMCSNWQTETIQLPNNETNYSAYEETLFETNFILNPKNNVIVFMLDDLDVDTFNKAVELNLLPNLKNHVLNRGINFVNAFATDSVCCPSRATFFTGQYSHNHGVLSNAEHNGSVIKFKDNSTLATWLQARNYKTALVGKYLNSYGVVDLTKDGRVDNNDKAYIPPGWTRWYGLLDWNVYKMYGFEINENGNVLTYPLEQKSENYQTNVLAKKALDFIKENARDRATQKRNQFFLYLAPTAPHVEILPNTPFSRYSDMWKWSIRPDPVDANRSVNLINLPYLNKCSEYECSFDESDVSDKPNWIKNLNRLTSSEKDMIRNQFRDRLLSLIAVDRMIGNIVNELIAQQVYNDTVFIFTSDNGFLYGEHRIAGKMNAFDESTRVPLIIAPAGGTSARNVRSIVLMNDLAPTIVEIASATTPPETVIDGRSLIPLTTNQNAIAWRNKFLIEHQPLTDFRKTPTLLFYDVPQYYAIRTIIDGRTSNLYIKYGADSQYEFYNLLTDPYALKSAILNQSEKAYFDNLITNFITCKGDACRNLENN